MPYSITVLVYIPIMYKLRKHSWSLSLELNGLQFVREEFADFGGSAVAVLWAVGLHFYSCPALPGSNAPVPLKQKAAAPAFTKCTSLTAQTDFVL